MKTLKESILDKDFDISESDEIRMLIEQIVGLGKWQCRGRGNMTFINSPSSYRLFDKILNIMQELVKNYKNPQSEVFYNRKDSIIYIIENARRFEGVKGIKIAVSCTFLGILAVIIYYSATFDYDSVTSEKGLKKIGTVPLDVITELKNKLQLNS